MKSDRSKQLHGSRNITHKLLPLVAGVAGFAVIALFILIILDTNDSSSRPDTSELTTKDNFDPQHKLESADLQALGWDEVNQALATIGNDESEIVQLTHLAGDVATPPAIYLSGLLLIAQQKPELALAAFNSLSLQSIPVKYLYAPHRLQQVLRPGEQDNYLSALRVAAANNALPTLIKARVQARDGDLTGAFSSYLQTDPTRWASYDLELFGRIGSNQGLSVDLARMITGAIASGRVKTGLLPQLKKIANQPVSNSEIASFEERIKSAIKHNTPEGRIAVESAQSLLRDRKIFMGKQYQKLIELYLAVEPIKLATETVLLLFLSAVDQSNLQQAETWGQELKRRHAEAEVRVWVNKMMTSL